MPSLVSVIAGMVASFIAGVLVIWETLDFLIRHSRYRSYANGHLFHR